uniref:L-2-amino-thiazoline-4-carboxylic acid hydrolase n=1 Tax=Rhodosorus marinus TaxID=101924 RepID=A0A7S0G6E9_9RHOD|mmetsp:Transcript_2940/g.4211  ORF Transcript_2940/g.4211 Transcript_2940/m.4211 type:complete len:299 (+) Transcript_2940:261-1157(+)|eukprot:CAMPEP_0184746800 /NCGR_PEP_ID=MMETSP0315-20130426/9323_1 /TAXON_ID=101924 /ORGANISM="Rhodosorus marinus, Strain UTEX LB 2760" /LENGTH=298 /DNA_ID=CAMNT_0027219537 /DNA_START=270 /DNA_END=1166 /DNA_ORIENTATION=+
MIRCLQERNLRLIGSRALTNRLPVRWMESGSKNKEVAKGSFRVVERERRIPDEFRPKDGKEAACYELDPTKDEVLNDKFAKIEYGRKLWKDRISMVQRNDFLVRVMENLKPEEQKRLREDAEIVARMTFTENMTRLVDSSSRHSLAVASVVYASYLCLRPTRDEEQILEILERAANKNIALDSWLSRAAHWLESALHPSRKKRLTKVFELRAGEYGEAFSPSLQIVDDRMMLKLGRCMVNCFFTDMKVPKLTRICCVLEKRAFQKLAGHSEQISRDQTIFDGADSCIFSTPVPGDDDV